MAVLDELVRLYKPEAPVLAELLVAYQALKMAQNKLGWDPGGKSTEPVQSDQPVGSDRKVKGNTT
jgi:hypothetical protein